MTPSPLVGITLKQTSPPPLRANIPSSRLLHTHIASAHAPQLSSCLHTPTTLDIGDFDTHHAYHTADSLRKPVICFAAIYETSLLLHSTTRLNFDSSSSILGSTRSSRPDLRCSNLQTDGVALPTTRHRQLEIQYNSLDHPFQVMEADGTCS